jgi:hypothetical protein
VQAELAAVLDGKVPPADGPRPPAASGPP